MTAIYFTMLCSLKISHTVDFWVIVTKRTSSPSSIIVHQHQSLAAYTYFYSWLSAKPLKYVVTIYQYKFKIFSTTTSTSWLDYPLPEDNGWILMYRFNFSYNGLIWHLSSHLMTISEFYLDHDVPALYLGRETWKKGKLIVNTGY